MAARHANDAFPIKLKASSEQLIDAIFTQTTFDYDKVTITEIQGGLRDLQHASQGIFYFALRAYSSSNAA